MSDTRPSGHTIRHIFGYTLSGSTQTKATRDCP
jgi:hypothetical protein